MLDEQPQTFGTLQAPANDPRIKGEGEPPAGAHPRSSDNNLVIHRGDEVVIVTCYNGQSVAALHQTLESGPCIGAVLLISQHLDTMQL